MKLKIRKLSDYIIFLVPLIFGCTESDSSLNPEANINYSENLKKIYPYFSNNSFEFDIDTLNSSNQQFYPAGSRISTIFSEEKIGGLDYFVCNQYHEFDDSSMELKTKFRISDKSVYLLSDTSKVSEIIPDSLSHIKISVDKEILLIDFPLEIGKKWPVVKSFVDFGTFKFNTVDVQAEYMGKEIISLNGFDFSVTSEKVKYKLDINFPDMDNPFLSQTVTYFAELWLAEDMGIVKMEGCTFMLNTIAGYPMNLEDIELNSRQILKNIK